MIYINDYLVYFETYFTLIPVSVIRILLGNLPLIIFDFFNVTFLVGSYYFSCFYCVISLQVFSHTLCILIRDRSDVHMVETELSLVTVVLSLHFRLQSDLRHLFYICL